MPRVAGDGRVRVNALFPADVGWAVGRWSLRHGLGWNDGAALLLRAALRLYGLGPERVPWQAPLPAPPGDDAGVADVSYDALFGGRDG